MKRFFIYSLPRSGSSWLSQFLSMPGSYCYHEPFADMGWKRLLDHMEDRPEPCVGAIDTSAYQQGLLRTTELDMYVLIRNKIDIASSFKRKGWLFDLASENDRFETVTRPLTPIHYSMLHDLKYLEDVWGQIVGTPFDYERASRLVEMNIQRTFASVAERVVRA